MNRKQRRAAHGQSPPAGGGDAVRQLLAQQCFINEYVFAATPEEDAAVA